jgi:hypothetical protein
MQYANPDPASGVVQMKKRGEEPSKLKLLCSSKKTLLAAPSFIKITPAIA